MQMAQKAFEEVIYEAIDAANAVLFEAGFKDKLVAELGFIDAGAAAKGLNAEVVTVEKCPCWDCVNPYPNGACRCNGPACR